MYGRKPPIMTHTGRRARYFHMRPVSFPNTANILPERTRSGLREGFGVFPCEANRSDDDHGDFLSTFVLFFPQGRAGWILTLRRRVCGGRMS